MANSKPFPEVPLGLLKRLEEAFPDRVPRDGTERDLYRAQGAQEVLDLLRSQYTKQQERLYVHAKNT
jgi:hypothetical protein